MRAGWLAVGLTLPFFGVDFLRVSSQALRLHMPAPLVALAGVIALGVVMLLMGDRRVARPLVAPIQRPLFVAFYLFLGWHVWSWLMSTSFAGGRKEVVKLAVSLLCLWGAVAFFPRDRRFLGRFFTLALWASVPLIAFLIYLYAFVFHSPFLGTNVEEEARFGRGQLAWYMSMLFPYAFFYFWKGRGKVWIVLPTMVLVVALLYNQTRGAWISVVAGLLFAMLMMWRGSTREALRLAAATLAGTALMVVVGVWVLGRYVDLTEFAARVISIFYPEAVPHYRSYDIRWAMISGAFFTFLRFPLIGVGLANTTDYLVRITHNDVMTILLELGLVGMALFIAVVLLLAHASGVLRRKPPDAMDWLDLATRAAFVNWLMSMQFINVYTSVHFWLFPALFMVAGSTPAAAPARAKARRFSLAGLLLPAVRARA